MFFVSLFYSNEHRYDIAMVKFDRPLTLDNQFIIPACIDQTGTLDVSNKVTWLTGWGGQYFNGPTTTLKYQVAMKIFDQNKCQTKYGSVFNPLYQICGGELTDNSGACQGDSGGPLVYQNPADNKWYLVGLISWGYGCKFFVFVQN
jgi:secreted trypsin-like serine protease